MILNSIDADLYAVGVGIPSKGSYIIEIDGQIYKSARGVTKPEHKKESSVVMAAGGQEALGHTTGVLNADADGTFDMLDLGGARFLQNLQLKNPVQQVTEITFGLTCYAIDPITSTRQVTHRSEVCKLSGWKTSDVGSGSEASTMTFTFKSLREVTNELYSVGR